ncbi:hypothetical protein ACFLQK_02875, partial [bacterium]
AELKAEVEAEIEAEVEAETEAETKPKADTRPEIEDEVEIEAEAEYEAEPGEFPRIDNILKELDTGEAPEAEAEELETDEEEPVLYELPEVYEPSEEADTVEITAATGTTQLLVTPPDENFFVLGTDFLDLGNIVDSGVSGAKVSASGVGMTFGLQLPAARIEHTTTGFKLTDSAGGTKTTRKVNIGVTHASVPLHFIPGINVNRPTVFGIRHFRNSTGKVTEVYANRPYKKNRWTLTPGVDYLQTAVRNDGFGGQLDVSYKLGNDLDIVGNMNTSDFFKAIINDHLLPYTPTGTVMGCDACDRNSRSVGVKYRMKQRKAKAWFMVYDIGDLDAPMGGITAEF